MWSIVNIACASADGAFLCGGLWSSGAGRGKGFGGYEV